MVLNRSDIAVGGYRDDHRRAVGTFPTRSAAEHALHELRDSGFVMDHVAVVAQDSNQADSLAGVEISDRAENKADDGVKVGAVSGGALGGLTGLLVGLGALAIPGIGPIMLAGAAATALATTAAGSAIGAVAGSLLGGLVGMGIPEERARAYDKRVSAGEYLVMVDGTDAEIGRAEAILSHRGVEEWGVYDIPVAQTSVSEQPSLVRDPMQVARPVWPVEPTAPIVTPPVAARPVTNRAPAQPALATDPEAIKLYEERLIVETDREKTGEVSVGKRIEVETAHVSLPLDKERVVIERVAAGEAVAVGADAFQDDSAIRVELYEEAPEIRKETFVREEVTIRKEVTHETVDAEETLRREELEVNTQDHPALENRSNLA